MTDKYADFKQQLDALQGGMQVVLEEFLKAYVLAKMHPANEAIQDQYQATVSSINQLQATLFSLSNEVDGSVKTVNNQLLERNKTIQQEKKKNRELKKKLGITENKNKSATEMIQDYEEMYDLTYLRNWALFVSTLGCLWVIHRVYKTPTMVV